MTTWGDDANLTITTTPSGRSHPLLSCYIETCPKCKQKRRNRERERDRQTKAERKRDDGQTCRDRVWSHLSPGKERERERKCERQEVTAVSCQTTPKESLDWAMNYIAPCQQHTHTTLSTSNYLHTNYRHHHQHRLIVQLLLALIKLVSLLVLPPMLLLEAMSMLLNRSCLIFAFEIRYTHTRPQIRKVGERRDKLMTMVMVIVCDDGN